MMKELAVDSIQNRNISCGVKEDLSMVLQRFVDTQSVRYEMFAEVWRNAKMPLIFAGRQNEKEVREFTEECLSIASDYLNPSHGFQVQVGGIYLLYGLYFKQLCNPRVKIRMTLTMWQNLMRFLVDIRSQNHFDIEYIYWKLRHDSAFHFVAHTELQTGFSRDHPLEADRRTEVEPAQIPTQISQLVEGDAVDQLSGIHEQYHRMKCALAGPTAQTPQASLNMIHPSLVQTITKKVASFDWWKKNKAGKRTPRRRHDSGPTTSESEADSETERSPSSPRKRSKNMGRIRAEIKARAMGSTSVSNRSRRHRQVRSASDQAASQSPSSSGSPRKPASRGAQHTGESDEGGEPQQDSQACDSKEGVYSMPLFRHLEVSKTKHKKTRRKQKKMQAVSSADEDKTKSGNRRRKKGDPVSVDLLSSSMEEGTTPKPKRKPRTKASADLLSSSMEEGTTPKPKRKPRAKKLAKTDQAEGSDERLPGQETLKQEGKNKDSEMDAECVDKNLAQDDEAQPMSSSDVCSPELIPSVSLPEDPQVDSETSAVIPITKGRRGRKKQIIGESMDQTVTVTLKEETDQNVSTETVEMETPTPSKRGRGRPPKARRGRPLKKS